MFHPEEKILKQKAVQDFKTEIYIDFITILPFKNLLLFCKSICKVRLLKTSHVQEAKAVATAEMLSCPCRREPRRLLQGAPNTPELCSKFKMIHPCLKRKVYFSLKISTQIHFFSNDTYVRLKSWGLSKVLLS